MPRPISPALLVEWQKQSKQLIGFFEGEFASGTVRVWTGVGDIQWDSKTWNGIGIFAGLSAIKEAGKVVAWGFTVSLTGVAPELRALVLIEVRRKKPGKVWLGALDTNGQVIADPHQFGSGRLSQPNFTTDGETADITISYENRYFENNPLIRRYTDADQQGEYPGDRGFEYIAGLQDKQFRWGPGA